MKHDLQNDIGREALAKEIVENIDAFCVDKYSDGPRSHLGASIIGHPCSYYLWLEFRWAHHESFSGRMLRLFNRGHREESRWIEWLRGARWDVREYSQFLNYHPESDSYLLSDTSRQGEGDGLLEDVTDQPFHIQRAAAQGMKLEQFRVSDCLGHFGGSLDSIATHVDYPGIEFLLEYKTHGTKAYTPLKDNGLRLQMPKHWAQKCTYGYKRNINLGIYCPINKNDDDITALEIVQLDLKLGEEMVSKAQSIIFAKEPPPKLSDNPSYYDCKYCPKKGVCHEGHMVQKNCRSCRHSEPRENATWYCTLYQQIIPEDFIPKGCDKHFSITGN